MKAYISGNTARPCTEDVKRRFREARELLEQLDFDVVNPIPVLADDCESDIHRLCDSLLLLNGCDVVLLLMGWQGDKLAQHEYDFAVREGKIILFEESFRLVDRLKDAICKVMGRPFEHYTTKSRVREGLFARMIFVHHCRMEGMKLTEIARLVGRDHSTMQHYLNRYDDEMKYNSTFRRLAESAEEILNRHR